MSYSIVILSAGKGTRFGSNIPKQYLLLAGKPILVHTLEEVEKVENISEVVVVCDSAYVSTIKDYIRNYNLQKNYIFVEGGDTRQASVYNGVRAASCDNIILHEAARPFVFSEDYEKLISFQHDFVSFTYPIPFTVLKKSEDRIADILNREELVNIQLPQKFTKKVLLEAHEKAIADNRIFTEDAGMIKYYTDSEVYCLKGSSQNIKITEYIDLLFADVIYKEKMAGRKKI